MFSLTTFYQVISCSLTWMLSIQSPGTMRNNRIRKCPLADVCDMKKRERGSYDFKSTSNLEIVRWNDNSVVIIGSNACRVEPVRNAKRWVRGKGKGNITQPVVIAAYNRGMGGVNLLDRALSDLRPYHLQQIVSVELHMI